MAFRRCTGPRRISNRSILPGAAGATAAAATGERMSLSENRALPPPAAAAGLRRSAGDGGWLRERGMAAIVALSRGV